MFLIKPVCGEIFFQWKGGLGGEEDGKLTIVRALDTILLCYLYHFPQLSLKILPFSRVENVPVNFPPLPLPPFSNVACYTIWNTVETQTFLFNDVLAISLLENLYAYLWNVYIIVGVSLVLPLVNNGHVILLWLLYLMSPYSRAGLANFTHRKFFEGCLYNDRIECILLFYCWH